MLISSILLQLQNVVATSDKALFQAEKADFLLLPATDIDFPLPADWELVAVPKRAAMKPVLVALDEQIHFENFTRKLRIGVFSPLYQKMLEIHFPQVESMCIYYAENVAFLLEKNDIEGMFLPQFEAEARELSPYIVQKCSLEVFTPQAAEGIVFIIGKKGNPLNETVHASLHHAPTATACEYEKAFITEMKYHTKSEIFAYATLFMDTIMMNVGIISENGKAISRQKVETSKGNINSFIKNAVENVLLNK